MKDEDEKPERNWGGIKGRLDLRQHVENHGISADEMYDLLAGDKYRDLGYRYIRDSLSNWGAEHNTPALMNRVFDKHFADYEEAQKGLEQIVDDSIKDKDSERYDELKQKRDVLIDQRDDAKNAIYEISRHGNLGDKQFSRLIDSENDFGTNYLNNKNIQSRHLLELAEKKPEKINDILKGDNIDGATASKLLQNKETAGNLEDYYLSRVMWKNAEGYDNRLRPNPDMDQKLNLDASAIHTILDNNHNLNQATVDMLLDHVSPEYKHNWINERLGIKNGGKIDPDLDDDDNWDNWDRNDFKPEWNRYERNLANSRHLNDSQAEHIKRHGSFDQRYDLYHNEHIDSKHGAEMFQKWHDDDHHHGYDSDELISRYKEDKDDIITIDELDEDTIEEIEQEGYDNGHIDEAADQEYPISDWIDDNEDEIVKRIVTDGGYSDDVIEDADQRTIDGYDDWTASNPNSEQNVGNPVFDALDSLHQEYFDSENYLDVEDIKNHTGIDDISKLGLTADEDDQVSTDDIKAELDKFGGPSVIDYSQSEDFNYYDHPEWEERHQEHIEDAVRDNFREKTWDYVDSMYLYEDHRESDRYQEAMSEARSNYVEENAKEHMDSLYDVSHQDTRFIPRHLHSSIPNFEQIHENNKKQRLDGPNRSFLDRHIKDRSYNHSYGDNQHHHEMVLDYAKANNGKIDIGTMNRFHPNQKDVWKKIFDGKGKMNVEEIEQKIEELPKTKYDISYGQWGRGKTQNLNSNDQVILRLDHSLDSIKPLMEDKDLYNTFKKVQYVSKRSGHPTNSNTIGWARIDTSDPKHWMIDEVQSDFGKSVINYLKREGAEHKASHVQKIQDYHKNWREAIMNAAIKEAKKHGVEKVSTHSPESKSSHANYGSSKIHSTYKKGYKQVPRAMGFQPVHHSELPINEKGRKHFERENDNSARGRQIEAHKNAYLHHWTNANLYDLAAQKQPEFKDKAWQLSHGHKELADKHLGKLKTAGITVDDINHPDIDHPQFEDEYGFTIDQLASEHFTKPSSNNADFELDKPFVEAKDDSHQGHTYHIIPKLKKYIQEITDLYKSSKSKWLERFEELSKGSRQSKIPFNPKKDISDTDRSDVENWTGGYGYQDRNMIPKIPENAKKRALDKLHKLTDVKKHPITGERMFLMHRGMGEGEYNEDHYQTGIRKPKGKTSWTPDWAVAQSFAEDYTGDFDGYKPRLVSAWIPESQIHHIPNAIGSRARDVDDASVEGFTENPGPSHRYKEHEVIVNPHKIMVHYANKPSVDKKRKLNSRINERKNISDSYGTERSLKFGTPEEQASTKQKLQEARSKKLQQFNRQKLTASEKDVMFKNEKDLNTPSSTVKLNPEHGKMIADAYHNMEHQPDHPEVKSAYGALINETKKQYQDMMNSGFKISRIQPGQPNPYKNSKELHDDIRNNNHMWYFPTEHGYGSDPSQKVEHPMLQGTGHFHDDNELLANDLFRIVHDYYGHHKGGESGFGPKGEHRAYLTHKKMFSPMAQKALASETLGQNSWVNYGPHADHNKANPANTIYADQKAGLLPDHIIQGNWHMADNEIKKAEKKNQKTQEDKIHESLDKLRVGYEHDRGDIDTKTPEGKEKIKGKLTTKGIHSSLYSIPSEKNIKGVPKKTGHQAGTINVFGAHYPVVKVLNDNTLLLHTSDYGDAGEGMGSKTRQLVEKIQKEVPEYFPDMKIIKIHHPDYTHSARVMRDPNSQIVSDFLNGASQHHPDEEYRQHALEAHQHLNPVKKGFNTKPIHQKRIEGEGWDGKKNIQNRVEKLGRYLQKIGLTVDQPDGEYGRTMGESSPTGLGVNPKGDPHDQQLIHEAGHAVLTPEDARLEDYQEFIGAPGPDAKIKASRERQSMQSMHGGGMPEQTAQHAEASIARRSGINPFRVPKRGRRSNTAEEGARRHAKEQIELLDEGIHRFDPVSGKKEIQPTVNAHINAKARKDKHLKEKVRNKLKQKMKEKKRMRQEDPMGYDFVYSQNSRLPKSEKITNNINKNDDMDASTGVSDPFITDQEKIDMDRRKDRRRRFKKQLLKEENLEKGIMDGIRNTAIIAGLAAGAHNMSPKKQPQALRQPLSVQAEQARQKRPMDDYSKRIRDSRKRHFFRSADRKLHPNKIMSTVANNPELKERYGHMLKSPYDMVQATRKNPDMKEDIYHTHFNNLYDVHEGNLDRIEESWSKPE